MIYIIDGIPRVNGRAGWLRWMDNTTWETTKGERLKKKSAAGLFLDAMGVFLPKPPNLFWVRVDDDNY